MDDKKKLVERFYNDYYLGDHIKRCRIKKIEFDKQGYFVFSKINQIDDYKDFDEYIKHFSKQFFKENLNIDLLDKSDSLAIDKAMSSILYPFILNIDRLKILDSAITEEQAINIFGISISDIYDITGLIILRVLIYNDYIYRKNMTSNDRMIFFGTTKPTCWFSAKEINILNKDIELECIKKYLELFSVELEDVSTVEDTKKIIKAENNYILMYLGEFCTYIFNECEKLIIEYFKNLKDNKLDSYYKKRGKSFEKYVRNILRNIYNDVITNAKYIDDKSRKMELDNLIIKDDICINFECKSSGFNIYNAHNDTETMMNMKKAFGRGYFSIDTFHRTLEKNEGGIELEIENKKQQFNLKDKKVISFNITLYPVEFLSTSIHFFDKEIKDSISVFPITINVIDLHSIILLSNINKELFEIYAKERYFSINNIKKFKIDYDEIDAFGYVTDDSLNNGYKMMKKLANVNPNVEQHIMINNSAYRKEVNAILASFGVYVLVDELLDVDLKRVFEKIFPKNEKTNS